MVQSTNENLGFICTKYNIKCMIRITEFEQWFETIYARPLNVLGDPQYFESRECLVGAFETKLSRPRTGRL
uniref:Uncharacterized protein n=1 Tax=Romanomermis culicivorax TaxID=13658 RepID=A0A915JN65_ROMCU